MKETGILLLMGLAIMVALVLTTYILSRVMQWCCRRCRRALPKSRTAAAEAQESTTRHNAAEVHARALAFAQAEEARDAGMISRKAQLFGLRVEERQNILKVFFQQHIQTIARHSNNNSNSTDDTRDDDLEDGTRQSSELCSSDDDDDEIDYDNDVETGAFRVRNLPDSDTPDTDEGVPGTAGSTVDGEDSSKSPTTPTETKLNDDKTTTIQKKSPTLTSSDRTESQCSTSSSSSFDPDDINTMCCICLLPYEPGVSQVISGTQCDHLFHFECCQAWLLKHDHCPYCRQDMLLSSEFRQAAIEVLGVERVTVLTRHSQATARPMAFANNGTQATAPPPPASSSSDDEAAEP